MLSDTCQLGGLLLGCVDHGCLLHIQILLQMQHSSCCISRFSCICSTHLVAYPDSPAYAALTLGVPEMLRLSLKHIRHQVCGGPQACMYFCWHNLSAVHTNRPIPQHRQMRTNGYTFASRSLSLFPNQTYPCHVWSQTHPCQVWSQTHPCHVWSPQRYPRLQLHTHHNWIAVCDCFVTAWTHA